MNQSEILRRLTDLPYRTEDDVREEFVTPLLRLLGYDFKRGEIARCVTLDTPYYSGTKRKEYIQPDYKISCDGCPVFVIDAKSPSEDPADASYVSQVHSYASHRAVGVGLFVITNALATLVFHANSRGFEPLVIVALEDLHARYHELARHLGRQTMSRAVRLRSIFHRAEALLFQEPPSKIITRLIARLDDLVAGAIPQPSVPVQPAEPAPGTTLVLETTLLLQMALGSERQRVTIAEGLDEAQLLVPEYVLMELNRTIIRDAMFLYDALRSSETVADALRRLSSGIFPARTSKRVLFLLATLLEAGAAREDMLAALRLVISRGAAQYLPANAKVIDHVSCPLAKAVPFYDGASFDLYGTCTRSLKQCRLPHFLRSKQEEMEKVLSATESTAILRNTRFTRVLRDVIEDPEKARGSMNCWAIGDVIIALHQPPLSSFVTFDRRYEVICRALEKDVFLMGRESIAPRRAEAGVEA